MTQQLTIEQLKFALEIGATHWDYETEKYRRDGYLYHNDQWVMGFIADSYYEYDDIVEIDFSPLDEEGSVEVKSNEPKTEGIVVYQERIPEGCSVRVEKDEATVAFDGNYYFTKTATAYEKTMQAIRLLAEAKEG